MLRIRELLEHDLEALRRFTDREIGAGYYSAEELECIYKQSQKDGVMYSLVLAGDQGEICAVRFTYPPGQWQHGKGHGLLPQKWPHPQRDTAYFQSLFVAANLQGQDWGSKISRASLGLLKRAGAKGVVCHAWKESPHNSSVRYLTKLGFVPIADHPHYWRDVNYNCTRCLKPPCRCTAQEMYLDLERIP